MPEQETDAFAAAYQELAANDDATEETTSAARADEEEAETEGGEEPTKDETDDTEIRLDGSIEDALRDNPTALKRLQEQIKGVNKLRKRFDSPDIQNAKALLDAFNNPDTAKIALERLEQSLTAHYGWDAPKTQPEATTEEQDDFEYPSEKQVFERAKAAAEKMVRDIEAKAEARIAKLEAQLSAITGESAERNWLETNAAKIKAQVKTAHGWEVTDKMLREAKAAFPKAEDIVDALKRTFPDEYADARAALLNRPRSNGKPMVQGKPVGNASGKKPETMDERFQAAYDSAVANQ